MFVVQGEEHYVCNNRINRVKMKNELISIIVPVYNVEQYLNNCINSIVSQTYHNIEIILVDDGSTDKSGEICDKLKQRDGRIVVVHKINGGLSDARNAGLNIASGRYVMFVDSDDYIPNYAVDYLYKLLKDNDSNVAIGALRMTKELDSRQKLKNGKIYLYNNKEAIGQILYANLFSTSAPAKLYEKKLFDDIRFPVGKLHEDLYTIYKVIDKAHKVVYGNEIVYFYFHRVGSITASKFSVKRLDAIDALKQLKTNINLKEYGIQNAYSSQIIENIFSYFSTDISVEDINNYKLWNMVKENRVGILFDNQVSVRIKGYVLLSYMGPKITMAVIKCYYKRKWK